MRKLPKFVTQEEFEELFKAVIHREKRATSKSYKATLKQYRVALLLAFEAGMRISEVLGYIGRIQPLKPSQVESACIRIISGKGQKDRIVPRPKRLNDAAVQLLPLKVKRRALQLFITNLAKKVLGKDISYHSLRHGFGSHLAGQGRPLHEIQMLMGHSRLDTTGIYLHANPKQAVEGARDVF